MQSVSQRQIVVERIEPITPHEIADFAEQIGLSNPDMNFDILLKWLDKGFRAVKIALWNRFGPAYGGTSIFFLLQNPEGKEIATIVSPGKKVAHFIRQHAEEWERNGVVFEKVQWSVRQG